MEAKNCCFCMDLRTGSLIIGYLILAKSFFVLIYHCMAMVCHLLITSMVSHVLITTMAIEKHPSTPMNSNMMIAFSVLAVFFFINLIFSSVLLIGLHMHKRGYVKAYLIYTTIFIIVRVIPIVACIVYESSAVEIAAYIVNFVLYIYFLIVIRSYWLKMDDASSTPAVDNTPFTIFIKEKDVRREEEDIEAILI